jgi:cytochrome c553
MTKWAAGLLLCAVAVALALTVASPRVGGQPATALAPAAGSAPAPTSGAPPATSAARAPTPEELAAMSYPQRYAALCAVCHGANGRTETPLTPFTPLAPVLAGQPSLYVITQLFLFREGRRSNEAMTAVAKALTDDDLRGFSEFIGTLPPVPPPPPATPPDPIRMARGQALAEQHKCLFCHGPGLAGGQQVPLIGGQHEDYLQASLRGFHSGSRPGYTQAMTAAMSQIPPEDLDPMAYFVARFLGPADPLTGK